MILNLRALVLTKNGVDCGQNLSSIDFPSNLNPLECLRIIDLIFPMNN